MTVAELIKELEKVENKTVRVRTEGCDCYGDVASVEFDGTVCRLERPLEEAV
jgi:hypothetical protein